ncbi:MAG: sel1 repeat family protein [Telmatospirillum sp.]|nr:sel1 repeat family protein [Telmatospirillum sp.]
MARAPSIRTRSVGALLAAAAYLFAAAQAPAPETPAPEAPATQAPAAPEAPRRILAAPPTVRVPPSMRPGPAEPEDLTAGKAEFAKGNYGTAYVLLLPYGQRGDPEAQFMLGRISDEGGNGVALDPREALRWYRLAATKEYPKALYAIARAYATGRGVDADPQQAINYLTRAANVDFTPALLDMASLFDGGRGIDRDRAQAFALYKRAAELGNTEARFVIAERLYNGDGTGADRAEAQRWYMAAGARGHPGALFRMAQLGFGTNRASVEYRVNAYTWLTLAQQRGGAEVRAEATTVRNELAKTMIQVDIDTAMARVRAWRPSPPSANDAIDPEDPYNDPDKMRVGAGR